MNCLLFFRRPTSAQNVRTNQNASLAHFTIKPQLLHKGVKMSLHYQVNTDYTLTHGKPSLTHITINTTKSAVTTIPLHQENTKSLLRTYRIFHTLQYAHLYIAHLCRVYSITLKTPPVLDSGQQDLFSEASK